MKGLIKKELLIHDQYCEDSTLANLLSGFDYPEFPVPMGVLRQVEEIPYEEKIEQQIKTQIEKKWCRRSGKAFKRQSSLDKLKKTF